MQNQQAESQPGLSATVIGEKTVPSGCRVINVSGQGMLLHCDPDGRPLSFHDGDPVDIHLTVQHEGGQKKLTIPSIVRHASDNSIDVEFGNPDPVLLDLIESYRVSSRHHLEAVIDEASDHTDEPAVIRMPNDRPATSIPLIADVDTSLEEARSTSSRFRSAGILLASTTLVAAAYLLFHHLETRIDNQGVRLDKQASDITDIQDAHFSASLLEGRYASLDARLTALGKAYADLEKRIPAEENLAALVAAGNTGTALSGEDAVNDRMPEAPPAGVPADILARPVVSAATTEAAEAIDANNIETTTATVRVSGNDIRRSEPASVAQHIPAIELQKASGAAPVDNDPVAETQVSNAANGPWVINLMSTSDRSIAEKFAAKADKAGIPHELTSVNVKGKTYWRLQVPGFESLGAARAYADDIKGQVSTEDAWFLKRKPAS